MNINKFEDQLKRLFEQYRPETDNDAIWKNIEPQLKKKKKRRGIIFFFWGLGLGLLLLFWWIYTPGIQPQPTVERNTLSPVSASGWSGQEKAPRPSGQEPNTIAVASTELDAAAIPTPESGKKTTAGVASIHESAALATTGNKAGKQPTILGKGNTPSPVLTSLTNLPTAENPSARTSEPAQSATPSTATYSSTVVQAEPAGPAINSAVENTVIQANPAADDPTVPATTLSTTVPSDTQQNADQPAEKLKNPGAAEQQSKNKKRRFPKPFRWPKIGWDQQLSVQAGPAMGLRQLRARNGSATYLAARKENEQSLEAYAARLSYALVSRRGLFLTTGLEYRQINEKFYRAYTTKETLQIIGVLTQTVDASGAVIGQTTGPKTVTRTTVYSNKVYNKYQFVNLPIGLGYQKSYKKSHWELAGGLDVNLLFRVSGALSSEFDQPVYLKAGDNFYGKIFRSKAGLGLWGSYSYGRNLTDQLSWQVGAQFQLPLHPVTQPGYELVQRYFNVGLQAGVVYQIKQGSRDKRRKGG